MSWFKAFVSFNYILEVTFYMKLIEGHWKLSFETSYNDFWLFWSAQASKMCSKINLNMTENCQNRNLKALEAFFIQLGSFFDRNCWETPQAFFYHFYCFIINLTYHSNQKWVKMWSKRSYFGSFVERYCLLGNKK